MAVIHGRVSPEAVAALRGVVDIYCWKGKTVARKWPDPPHQPGTPAQVETWNNQIAAHAWWKNLDPDVKRAWQQIPNLKGRTGHDLAHSAALRMSVKKGLIKPPWVWYIWNIPGWWEKWVLFVFFRAIPQLPKESYKWRATYIAPANLIPWLKDRHWKKKRKYWICLMSEFNIAGWEPGVIADEYSDQLWWRMIIPSVNMPNVIVPVSATTGCEAIPLTPPKMIVSYPYVPPIP